MTIKAIETKYKGYRFRSRLEARWAVCFDHLGLGWEYEPQGFELPSGSWYLPDFRVSLGKKKAWVEIKGGLMSGFETIHSRSRFPLPYQGKEKTDEFSREVRKRGGTVFLFGDIPEPDQDEIFFGESMFVTSSFDNSWSDGVIVMEEVSNIRTPNFYTSDFGNDYGQFLMNGDEFCYGPAYSRDLISVKVWWPTDAYKEARSARFEHGETPR